MATASNALASLMPPVRTPTYRLTVDGRDITPKINARLVSLSVNEARDQEADELDITLSDHDGALVLPPKGAAMALWLGWEGEALVDMGRFTVDELEHSGAPDVLTLRSRSADMRGAMKERRDATYLKENGHDALTVGDVLRTIAARHRLDAAIADGLASKPVPKGLSLQMNESDMNFLTRLGRHFDAVSTVKKGRLLFAPIGSAISATGQPLEAVTITRQSGDQHRYSLIDRAAFKGVRAQWMDKSYGTRRSATVGAASEESGKSGKSIKVLPTIYSDETEARSAAQAEWKRIQRGAAAFSLQLAGGNAKVQPECEVKVRGFKAEIDATEWLVQRVSHTLDESGWTTQIEMETAGTSAPQDLDDSNDDDSNDDD